jgi:hypothetical protein
MKLINEKMYIDLSNYLDLKSFDALEDRISYNIAKNEKYIEPSYTPHFSLLNKDMPGFLEEQHRHKNNHPELNISEINWYTKLKGTATLGSQLLLRGNKGYPKTYPYKHLDEYSFNLSPYNDFKFLFDWIDAQKCFDEYGRTMFWINEPAQITAAHTDYGNINQDKRDKFIWLTGKFSKRILLHDGLGTVHEISSRAMVFNTINWHCSKGHCDYVSWSLRIDGKFNTDWAERAGIKEYFGL